MSETPAVWPAPSPTLYGTRHSVSSGHCLASAAAFAILEAGGNAVDAWITALRDYGTLSFADAAMRLAADGFAVFPLLADGIAKRQAGYRRWPANEAIYLPDGRPPIVGERFVQTDLARAIRLMIDAEATSGGYLAADDLAEFRSRDEPVVSVRRRDVTIVTCGAWCQGPILSEALAIVEKHGIEGMAHNSADYIHTVTEALKGAFADREHHYGDPAFVEVPLERMLGEEHIAARAAAIDPARAVDGLPPSPIGGSRPLPDAISADGVRRIGEGGTSYVFVVDRWGNAFSATPSDGASTAPVIPGTGIVPSLRGLQSRPDPAHPSGVAPGKRPRLTPDPAIAVRDDGSVMPFGCPGGDMQVQAMLQVFLNVFHFGMDPQEAVDAPRFSTWSFPDSFAPFDCLAAHVFLEDRFDEDVYADLVARGHDERCWPAYTRDAAAVEAVYRNAPTGFLESAADPRQPAQAVVS
ncbi:gamma-glutamyltransferase family protein [Microbacterium sp. SORGH_AS_0888]|uniref:gamma-glutamyltransferase family protein n=1 Tax=Microbacterium sp. SORGH_AS_0888 TaxID=3041791 RepID=UPI0027891E02|nr:gamma-glutamyltransferase [Microbacterium sp. SORGH_AS_0888]MDQ1129300.1 gamma-glutamyltranspeptidase/glutathione hydrolase [Microbacterium sp. SORGH_AS_0888]